MWLYLAFVLFANLWKNCIRLLLSCKASQFMKLGIVLEKMEPATFLT
ncbi:Ribosomal protein L11 methyltransferase [Leptospira santarosai]|uniref:Ribosomal protein L11 methyltransferase n=1 Tax=Leptospira santarosai TaxID=28183 RepID=A0A2P1QNY4_9LEPT|nr:Ribosomal protein L11 methyltransferase [Leptospira santarosai]